MAELAASGVSVHFDGVRALDRVDFTLRCGEIVGLIGPNGAGKTTLVNALSGFQRLDAGTVTLDGRDVSGWSPQRRARAGVVRSFQAVRLFARLSVVENVELGALGRGASRRGARAVARDLLSEYELDGWAGRPVHGLPLGDERTVGLLRALAALPDLLLLDEPAAGLNETESDRLGEILADVRDRRGCGVCVIEHDMRLIMTRCERVHVLAFGETLAVGTPEEIRRHPEVLTAYLGEAA
jgi:branched-chain amino acid transport system ATP-binding protein